MESSARSPYDPGIRGPTSKGQHGIGIVVQRQVTQCIHRWVLSEPSLQTVRGVCRRCGAHRTYPAGLEYYPQAFTEYEELDRSRPLLAKDAASLEEHILA